MHCFVLRVFLTVLLLNSAVLADGPITARSQTAEPVNFLVRTYHGGPSAVKVNELCEQLRAQLQCSWLGAKSDADWRPRCEVVLHPTRARYLQAVGRGGGSTSGSSLIRLDQGRIILRRIDLLVDDQGGLPALPHELTHVVLADRFGGQPPRWLDEGIATMTDTVGKRTLHHRDCQEALRNGTALRIVELLSLERFATAQQVPAFYGQSLSLVHFLAEQDEPERVITFAVLAQKHGYDHALRTCYEIDGIADLDHKWRDYAMRTLQSGAPATVVAVSYRP